MLTITDELLTLATGLTGDAVRKCVDWGVLASANPDERGRGKRRHWGDETVGNAARIVALRRAGLSLPQAAALLAIGGFYWRPGTRFPSMVSRRSDDGHPDNESAFNKFLKMKSSDLRPRSDDLYLEILDGYFIFEASENECGALIAQMGDGALIMADPNRKAIIEETVGSDENNKLVADKKMPIVYGHLTHDRVALHRSQPVVISKINMDLCARVAIRDLFSYAGFVPAE